MLLNQEFDIRPISVENSSMFEMCSEQNGKCLLKTVNVELMTDCNFQKWNQDP